MVQVSNKIPQARMTEKMRDVDTIKESWLEEEPDRSGRSVDRGRNSPRSPHTNIMNDVHDVEENRTQDDTNHDQRHRNRYNQHHHHHTEKRDVTLYKSKQNPHIKFTPHEEIVFRGGKNNQKDIESNIIAVNSSPFLIAYKVLCNSPTKYAVSPSSGVLEPDASVTLICHLKRGMWSQDDLDTLDKFLILTTKVSTREQNFKELFKNIPRHDVFENRILITCKEGHKKIRATGSVVSGLSESSAEDSTTTGSKDTSFYTSQEAQAIAAAVEKLRDVLSNSDRNAAEKLRRMLQLKLEDASPRIETEELHYLRQRIHSSDNKLKERHKLLYGLSAIILLQIGVIGYLAVKVRS